MTWAVKRASTIFANSSWSSQVAVGEANTVGCYVEVDQSSGDVYVAWLNTEEPHTIRARRSVDGGATFGPEVTVGTPGQIGHDATCTCSESVMNGDIRVKEYPSMAVNPLTGKLHVVYAADGEDPDDDGDVQGVIGRFITGPFSITKARAELEPGCLDMVINISDIMHAVGAFQGLSYPFEPTADDPCDSTCINPLPQQADASRQRP